MAQRQLVLACLIWAAVPLRLSGSCPRPGSPCEELNVVESFKGIDAGEFRAQFYFGLELDGFQPGRRYLIFAKRAVHGNL